MLNQAFAPSPLIEQSKPFLLLRECFVEEDSRFLPSQLLGLSIELKTKFHRDKAVHRYLRRRIDGARQRKIDKDKSNVLHSISVSKEMFPGHSLQAHFSAARFSKFQPRPPRGRYVLARRLDRAC